MMLVDVERGRAEAIALACKLEDIAAAEAAVEEEQPDLVEEQDYEQGYQHQ
jgi:hypothetical protein